MKILFLDIDGVLNSSRTTLAAKTKGLSPLDSTIARIDKTAVAMVNRLCDEHDMKIVLSSSHRYDFMDPFAKSIGEETFSRDNCDVFRMALYLQQLGIDWKRVIDATPEIMGPHSTRGKEIQRWMILNKDRYEIENYIVLDDTEIHGGRVQFEDDLRYHFVRCDIDEGFSFKNYRECENILGSVDGLNLVLPPK